MSSQQLRKTSSDPSLDLTMESETECQPTIDFRSRAESGTDRPLGLCHSQNNNNDNNLFSEKSQPVKIQNSKEPSQRNRANSPFFSYFYRSKNSKAGSESLLQACKSPSKEELSQFSSKRRLAFSDSPINKQLRFELSTTEVTLSSGGTDKEETTTVMLEKVRHRELMQGNSDIEIGEILPDLFAVEGNDLVIDLHQTLTSSTVVETTMTSKE
jgi:hypothetical protein